MQLRSRPPSLPYHESVSRFVPLSPLAQRRIPRIFWSCAILAIVIWASVPGYDAGWDLRVYKAAIVSVRAGQDPYEDGMARQRVYHATKDQLPPGTPVPFTYVYSPITLPPLAWIGRLPLRLTATLYLAVYAISIVAAIWVGLWAVEDKEHLVFSLLAPAAVFFPGLLQTDVLFSGNLAYILQGGALLAAWNGWRKGRWLWFYLLVLLASCYKAPLLYLLAIPVLSTRRQWLPAALTGFLGVGFFAIQPRVWPVLFQHYLEAVELQFSYNHDFSASPAGLLANAFYNVIPYKITSVIVYLLTVLLVAGILLVLRKRFLAGIFSLKQWVPFMLVGVALLNPRIMEYDVAPLTLMMALVAWRFFSRIAATPMRRTIWMAASFAAFNIGAAFAWRWTEGILLTALFAAGSWDLFAASQSQHQQTAPGF